MSIPLASYTQYVPLDRNEIRTKFVELSMVIERGLKVFGINKSDVTVNNAALMEIIERVEKRRVYFMIYYGIEMSEKNEAALYCFWLLKFLPLHDKSDPENEINIKIALHLLLSSITYTANKIGHSLSLKSDYIRHLAYSFKYRDVSKEAIMSIMESLLA